MTSSGEQALLIILTLVVIAIALAPIIFNGRLAELDRRNRMEWFGTDPSWYVLFFRVGMVVAAAVIIVGTLAALFG